MLYITYHRSLKNNQTENHYWEAQGDILGRVTIELPVLLSQVLSLVKKGNVSTKPRIVKRGK